MCRTGCSGADVGSSALWHHYHQKGAHALRIRLGDLQGVLGFIHRLILCK